MAFTKGHTKQGGKQAGSKNKKTLILDSFAKTICDGGMEKFQSELSKLTGKDYVTAFLSIFEYVKPKLSRQTIDAGEGTTVKISIKKKTNGPL